MTKIIIAGAAGRTGQALVRCSARLADLELVGAIEQDGHPALGTDAGEVAGIGPVGVSVTADLPAALVEGDVLIDFTFHGCAPENARQAATHYRAFVLGTTGLTPEEAGAVSEAAAKVPIVWAPNMSLGVNLLFAAVKKAGAVLGDDYCVTIDETHHVHKKDAPSGTALRLGEKVAEGRAWDFEQAMLHDPEGQGTDYPEGRIPIRSYRKGEVVGDHTVRFASETETVEFTHHAHSRDAFAMGALHAARWVASRRPRMYDMQDVLSLV